MVDVLVAVGVVDGFGMEMRMNVVALVGRISDRPFRPGGGARVVVKVMVQSRGGRGDQIEFDAFGELGSFAQGLWVRDLVSIEGRLEDRAYRVEGEEVREVRCVADRIEVLEHVPRSATAS